MLRYARLCLVAAIALYCLSEAQATILLFDQARDAATHRIVEPTTSGGRVEQDYGDRVSGSPQAVPGGLFTYGNAGEGFTPNVLVDYFVSVVASGFGVSLFQSGYGDLTNVAFGSQNSSALNIRLRADTGFDVLLYDFDLAGWSNADYTINAVRVLNGRQPCSRTATSWSRATSLDRVTPPSLSRAPCAAPSC